MSNEAYVGTQIENILRNFITMNSILISLAFGAAIYLSGKKDMFALESHYYIILLYLSIAIIIFLYGLYLCLKVSVTLCNTPAEKKALYEKSRGGIIANYLVGMFFVVATLFIAVLSSLLIQEILGTVFTAVISILLFVMWIFVMIYFVRKIIRI
jgi:hypothetical protein